MLAEPEDELEFAFVALLLVVCAPTPGARAAAIMTARKLECLMWISGFVVGTPGAARGAPGVFMPLLLGEMAYGATAPLPFCTAPSPPAPRPKAVAEFAPMPRTVDPVVMFALPTLLAEPLRPRNPIEALDRLVAFATVLEAAVPAPEPVEAVPPVPVDAPDVVAAVPIGGLMMLSVPAVASAVPTPDCVPPLVALPSPRPAVLLLVVPLEVVVAADVPPSRPELDPAAADVVFEPDEVALKPPKTVEADV